MNGTAQNALPMRQVIPAFLASLASTVTMLARAVVGALIFGMLVFCGAAQAKRVVSRPAPIGRPAPHDTPMHFALVKMAASDCSTNCAEWISAEGAIKPETALEFLAFLRQTGGRRLPVLINSNGGSIDSALEIGRLLRARHLDIAVTRTEFVGCTPKDEACRKSPSFDGYRGRPNSSGATCASACAYLIAGAEHRFVSMASRVGVHATSLLEPAVPVTAGPASAGKTGRGRHRHAPEAVARLVPMTDPKMIKESGDEIRHYMTEMGVSENIVTIAFAIRPETIHWMTRQELRDTRLATDRRSGEVLVASMPAAGGVVAAPDKPASDPSKQIASITPPAPVTTSGPTPPTKAVSIAFSTIPIASIGQRDFETALTFTHQPDEPTVHWTAEIRANGVTQPLWLLQLSLQLNEGKWFYALPDRRDLSGSVLLHGEIALHDYCDLAQSSQIRLRLAAPGPGRVGQREILSDPKSLDLERPAWPECAKPPVTLSQTP